MRKSLCHKIPNEAFVAIMKFLDRDTLETLQLVSNRHYLIVKKHFNVFPLRKVDRCKVITTRSGDLKLRLICHGRTIESDSDIHLWLRHCFVECIEFIEFKFTREILRDLQRVGELTFRLNYCVFDYQKRSPSQFVAQHKIDLLFSIGAFQKCHGAVFSFGRRCVFRPLISDLLQLPPKSMVIDFEGYKATTSDNEAISVWLNGFFDKQCEPKALFLKGFDYFDASQNLIETLQNDFVNSTTKQSFVLNIDCDGDMNFERKEGNGLTGEKFQVNTTAEGVICAGMDTPEEDETEIKHGTQGSTR